MRAFEKLALELATGLFQARTTARLASPYDDGTWSIHRATLGYGVYLHGREYWCCWVCEGDFLCSRWFDTPRAAVEGLFEAMRHREGN